MSNFSWHLAQDSCVTARSCANGIERLAMPSSTRQVRLESSKSRSSLSYTIRHIFFACTKTELICWLIRRIKKTDLLMETLLYYRPPAFVERRMSRKSDKNASVVLLSYKLVLARSLQGWAHLNLSWRSPPQPSSRRRHLLSPAWENERRRYAGLLRRVLWLPTDCQVIEIFLSAHSCWISRPCPKIWS